MRSIAIMNQKGGVGKTTTAVNLSAALAARGRRVCLVDLDPQAHATLHLGLDPRPDQSSIYQVLTGDARLGEVRRAVFARVPRVRIYGLDGTLVAELADATPLSGRRRYGWDGRDGDGALAPPGIYIAQLHIETDAGDETVQKLVHLVY